MPTSRLPLDPSTHRPTLQTLGQLSSFLRSSVADAEALEVGEGMSHLAAQIERIAALLKTGATAGLPDALMDLLGQLRAHRQLVVGLSAAWRGLYEYAAYLNALNNFRVAIGQRLMERDVTVMAGQLADFELVAWRMLGDGMLLIDMYEQWRGQQGDAESGLGALEDSRVHAARHWWERLRG